MRRQLRILLGLSHKYLRRRERFWILSEVLRRLFFKPRWNRRTVLLSFPRSGNHAIRGFLEETTLRPTLSALDSERFFFPRGLHDLPLFLRSSDRWILMRSPIAVKRHKIFATDRFQKLIYLERPLIEAVLSHGRDLSDLEFDSQVKSIVKWWLELREIYELWPENDKLLVRFEQIEAGDFDTFFVLGNFLGIRPSRIERFLSRNGLSKTLLALKRPAAKTSYSEKFPKRAKLVEAAVADLTY